MANTKKKASGFAKLLYEDRFESQAKSKKIVERNSVIEFSSISKLSEKMALNNKVIYNAKVAQILETIDQKYEDLISSIDFSLTIPPRIPYNQEIKEDYQNIESFCFNRWKLLNDSKVFERNLEIWRQFWIVCEKAETIIQIVDSRDPKFYINQDVIKMYPNKKHLIFCNKSDLITEEMKQNFISQRPENTEYYWYSAKNGDFNYPLEDSIGLIGYPNVGKSSTINAILKHKKVKVSSTPGKTKYFQTMVTDEFTLLDCPGLVFPKHQKIELMLMGILNIDQIQNLSDCEKQIIEFIGKEKIKSFYKLKTSHLNIIDGMSLEKGWIRSRCIKLIAKDFASGAMPYY